MAYEDSVLQRDMFRSRKKDVEGAGIASVPSDANEEGYNRRVEEAKALFAQARAKQDPSNFQTLSEQEKPGAFRPIQASATQAPQPNTQQQMAQMQAMGFRPVGMANGGYVAHMAEGGLTPTIRPAGSAGDVSMEYDNPNNMLTWTDSYMRKIAQEEADKNTMGGDLPEDFRKSSWAETDPEKIFKQLKLTKAQLRMQYPDIPAVDEDTRFPKERKDKSDFRDVSGEMEYDKRIREQEDAMLAARPDRRDYASEREYAAGIERIAEDAALREQGRPDKRDYASERPYYEAQKEQEKGIASLAPTASDDATANAINARLKGGIKGVNASATGTPTGANASTGATPSASSGIASTPQAAESVIPEKTATTMEGIKSERAKERAENINLAIIQAGLGMAAGTSPNALSNIAQGGMSGLKAFAESESESRKAQREAERAAREDERANRAFEEQRRQFGMTFGEAGRRFDIENARAERQMNIAADQFQMTYGLSLANAERDAEKFEKTFGLSLRDAELKSKQFAADQENKAQVLANDRAKLDLAREELKVQTDQAIATRDAKKLESSSALASQILNATNARIASLRASQKQNAMMGITDPAVEEEIKELARQAQEAKQNYYAVQESLGIRLPGAQTDPLGIRR